MPPAPPSYAEYRFPAEIISYAVWLYYRFPLSLRPVGELLAACGITVSHEMVRQWSLKFGYPRVGPALRPAVRQHPETS